MFLAGADDLTRLSFLHEPAILHNLRLRYAENVIYTYTGPILVALNPWKPLPCYGNDVMKAYMNVAMGEAPPHVFAMADAAFRVS